MTKRMLIDATHMEETRVAIIDGTHLEELDVETAQKEQIKGNIYLAKVIRTEPSLQAAFVEYGGNRHGFLAFSEIHPDYYQIPVADKEKLKEMLEEEQKARRQKDEDEDSDTAKQAQAATTVKDEISETTTEKPKNKRRYNNRRRTKPNAKENADSIVAADAIISEDTSVTIENEEKENTSTSSEIESNEAKENIVIVDTPITTAIENTEVEINKEIEIEEITEAVTDTKDEVQAEEPNKVEIDVKAGTEETENKQEAIIAVSHDDLSQDAEEFFNISPDEANNAPIICTYTPATELSVTGELAISCRCSGNDTESACACDQEEENKEEQKETSNCGSHGKKNNSSCHCNQKKKAKAHDEEEDLTSPKSEIEEIVSDSDYDEEIKKPNLLKNYKIQEVIKKGQVLLIQVLKEERGNKGAALTTYLSLAGRYCVLMPNTAHGGGVSRKITNIAERKQLKQVLGELKIPEQMGVIVRTAGKDKTKQEIKRDYDYLIRAWMNIRDKTLKAQAPSLIHEEANLVKRALRDLYSKDINEIIIDGEKEYRYAKEFMKMLSPNVVKKISLYKNNKLPLFNRYQIESQIAGIHNPIIQLRSGGYLVINQTEALVAIDINSGRSTKERTIEETALRTNLEAADEIARQLRLRDLSGLVVIDFIDMDEQKNNNAVERRMKEALKKDKARVQVGRISGFGLMEMSRQRLHSSFLEASYNTCECCGGSGLVRSVASCALSITRIIEEETYKNQVSVITITVNPEIALYILNHKRDVLNKLEATYGISILVMGDASITKRTDYRIEKTKHRKEEEKQVQDFIMNYDEIETEIEDIVSEDTVDAEDDKSQHNKRKRHRNNRNFYKKRSRHNKRHGDGEGGDETAGANTSAPSSNQPAAEKKKGWWQRLIK